MDAIQTTLTDMRELFHERMADFELQLQKSPISTQTTISSLAAEFSSFRSFIIQTLGTLQQQIEKLTQDVDNMEMRGRRKILLLHGVSEVKDEDTAQMVTRVLQDSFKLSEFSASAIKRCHRMGRSTTDKSRPILFKLHDVDLRDKIWFSKTMLKGSGITVSEFLTKARHNVFMAARDKFGVSQCWTREGNVYVLGPNGSRHRVASLKEFSKITQQQQQVEIEPMQQTTEIISPVKITVTKTKRAAARK